MRRFRIPTQRPWPIALRVLVAMIAGYALTSVLTTVLALMLTSFGMNKAEAVLAVTIVSFLVYAPIAMGIFYLTASRGS